MSIFASFSLPHNNNSKIGNRPYFELDARIRGNLAVEFRGLGVPNAVKNKQTTSDTCTLYILKNGVRVTKYHYHYLIDVPDEELLTDTLKLLEVDRESVETHEVSAS